jgi:phytoene/squalene synthetase
VLTSGMQHRVAAEDVFRGVASDALAEVVFQVADTAHAHVRMARELAAAVPPAARPALLPAVRACAGDDAWRFV